MDIFLGTLFIVICILLIVVVLLQKGRGGGLGAMFGGAGSSAFGTRTGDVFTWVTIVLTALFLILAIGASFAFRTPVQQLPKVEFDPPAGAIASPAFVSLTCAPGASIYYTTDNSEPTRNSPKYDVRIEVTPPVTVKARAYLEGYKESEITTAQYTPAEFRPPAKKPAAESQPAAPTSNQAASKPAS